MEELSNNKKPIIFMFVLLLCIFLFVHKGFIQNGEVYEIKYNEYLSELNQNNNGLTQGSLKKNKSTEKNNNSGLSKSSKIPPELLSMDNSLLDAKSVLSGMKDKNERIILSIDRIILKENNLTDDQLNSLLNQIKKDISVIQNGIENVDKNLEGVSSEIDNLRKKKE